MTLVINPALGEYYGVQGTTWQNPPILNSPTETRDGRRQAADAVLQRRQAERRRVAHAAGRLLGLQHADRQHRQPADGRDRRVADAGADRAPSDSLPSGADGRRAARTDRRDRHRLRRPRDRRRIRRARQRGLVRRHRRRQDRAAASAARSRSTSRAGRVASRATASGCTSRPSSRRRSSTRGCCSSPSARRRPTRATPTCPRSTRWSARCRASDRHALVMKSTVPVGTGAAIRRMLRRAGQGRLRLRLLPRVPQGGLGARGLPRTPTGSSSATTATGPATRSSSSTRRSTRRWSAPTSPAPR